MTALRRARQKGRVPDADGVYHVPNSSHDHEPGERCTRCRPLPRTAEEAAVGAQLWRLSQMGFWRRER